MKFPDCFVAPGFEEVRHAFEENFRSRDELGAAFAATRDGRLIVDLWGGEADRSSGRAWERDTLQLIFSGSKGLVAICLLILIDRGLLDLDAEVCRYWPEFAAEGKDGVTVRDVVSHTARMPALAREVAVEDLLCEREMANMLAQQPQSRDPRALRCYHPLTYGWLCGELLRRIDGRTLGRFFNEEVAAPLDLETFIGLPASLERRVSLLELGRTWASNEEVPEGDELARLSRANPPIWLESAFPWNDPRFHAAEIPAANAISTARSIARLYGSLEMLLSSEAIALGASQLERRHDGLNRGEMAFGVGFMLQCGDRPPFGPPARAFGHEGAGGSVHGCWPSERVGFSYAMNRLETFPDGDPRAEALLDALHRCVRSEAELGA